jgi:hypothetical protein
MEKISPISIAGGQDFASQWILERFQNSCALFRPVKGGVFLRKTPLDCAVPVYSNSGTAVRADAEMEASLNFARAYRRAYILMGTVRVS